MSNSYHGYQPGESVPTMKIVVLCQRRLDGGYIKGTSKPEKQGYIDTIHKCGHSSLIWTPISTGWGASPFNLNCWRSPAGSPITPR